MTKALSQLWKSFRVNNFYVLLTALANLGHTSLKRVYTLAVFIMYQTMVNWKID